MPETFLTSTSHSHFTQSSELTPVQAHMDGLVSTFVEKTMDVYAFTGIIGGIRAGRFITSKSFALGHPLVRFFPQIAPLAKASAGLGGLAVEASIMDGLPKMAKALLRTGELSPLHLYGEMGIRAGILHTWLSLLGFRAGGAISAYQNALAQALVQGGTIIASHHASALFGINDTPKENAGLQSMEAGAMVLQMWAGMSVVYRMAPGNIPSQPPLTLRGGASTPPLRVRGGRGAIRPVEAFEGVSPHILHTEKVDIQEPRTPIQGLLPTPSTGSPKPTSIFKDPLSAIANSPVIHEYNKGESHLVAQEGSNILVGEIKEKMDREHFDRTSYRIHYQLNEKLIGEAIIQTWTEEKSFLLIHIEIDPQHEGQGLGKLLALNYLYQAHRLGWTYVIEAIKNERLIHAAKKPFYQGHHMFSEAQIQMRGLTPDPWEPQLVSFGKPLPLAEFDVRNIRISNFTAYQIRGLPNPKLFEPLERDHPIPIMVVPRRIYSSQNNQYPFSLILDDFDNIFSENIGAEIRIAEREKRVLWMKLDQRSYTNSRNGFFKTGTPELQFTLMEGETRGYVRIYLEPNTITRHVINTTSEKTNGGPSMASGAGTIFTEWLATQAAIHGLKFNIVQIENPQILRILLRQNLMDSKATKVEACEWEEFSRGLYNVKEVSPWNEKVRASKTLDPERDIHFLNVRGEPNPELVPPSLRKK
jgi:GNAT superfamily N-acetyltransferase